MPEAKPNLVDDLAKKIAKGIIDEEAEERSEDGSENDDTEQNDDDEKDDDSPLASDSLIAKVAEAEARIEQMQRELDKRREADFQKQLEGAPEDQRATLQLEYERSRRMELETRLTRDGLRKTHPLFSGVFDIFSETTEFSFDSTSELADMADAVQPRLEAFFGAVLREYRESLRKQASEDWGTPGMGDSRPGRGPKQQESGASREYQAAVDRYNKRKSTDNLAAMIAARDKMARGVRG